jgi:hypothetical protein
MSGGTAWLPNNWHIKCHITSAVIGGQFFLVSPVFLITPDFLITDA